MLRHLPDGTLRDARYLEPIAPVVFPVGEQVSETQLHIDLRTLIYHLLLDHLGLEVTVGSDQFVYFDAADPKRCVAPDAYVRLTPRGEPIRSWKTWERGAPDIAVEIVSDSDCPSGVWSDKLDRYRRLGVTELVRFDPDEDSELKLRIWNRVEGALVERVVSKTSAPSAIFEMHWLLAPADGFPLALRIAAGSKGEELLPTRLEARLAAEARIRELEAELARRST